MESFSDSSKCSFTQDLINSVSFLDVSDLLETYELLERENMLVSLIQIHFHCLLTQINWQWNLIVECFVLVQFSLIFIRMNSLESVDQIIDLVSQSLFLWFCLFFILAFCWLNLEQLIIINVEAHLIIILFHTFVKVSNFSELGGRNAREFGGITSISLDHSSLRRKRCLFLENSTWRSLCILGSIWCLIALLHNLIVWLLFFFILTSFGRCHNLVRITSKCKSYSVWGWKFLKRIVADTFAVFIQSIPFRFELHFLSLDQSSFLCQIWNVQQPIRLTHFASHNNISMVIVAQ